MDGREINEALARVHDMQVVVLERRRFRGYSGVGRMVGGVAALGMAVVLRQVRWIPATTQAHLIGWSTVLLVALASNYGALWFWAHQRHRLRGTWSDAAPALDALPALAVGAVLSVALVRIGAYDLLSGTWMAVYGLVHCLCRRTLPPAIYALGLAYVACGALCLASPHITFLDPRPMGLVFGLGELVGGLVLLHHHKEATHE